MLLSACNAATLLRSVTFASTNKNKFDEVKSILALRVAVNFAHLELVEVQSDSLEEIAREKAKSAYSKVGRPVIVEDDGLYIDSLKGFPGQYSSFVFKTLGNAGILKLLEGLGRRASFRSIIAFYDGKDLRTFEGIVNGTIAIGAAQGGWGYDPIFIPEGTSVTFAELASNKSEYSHRKRALDKFADWFLLY
jgi:XTP/dITP diphosphohydrolase